MMRHVAGLATAIYGTGGFCDAHPGLDDSYTDGQSSLLAYWSLPTSAPRLSVRVPPCAHSLLLQMSVYESPKWTDNGQLPQRV